MEIIDDDYFAVTTFDKVALYDMSGQYIREIGRQGRALGEFNLPFKARYSGHSLFVWSSNDMKFLEYTLTGDFIGEYTYSSAISDFRVDFVDRPSYVVSILPIQYRDYAVLTSEGFSTRDGKIRDNKSRFYNMYYGKKCYEIPAPCDCLSRWEALLFSKSFFGRRG